MKAHNATEENGCQTNTVTVSLKYTFIQTLSNFDRLVVFNGTFSTNRLCHATV